jgi:hypothetical protein
MVQSSQKEELVRPLLKYLRNAGIAAFLLGLSAMIIGVYFWTAFVTLIIVIILILIDYECEPWVRQGRWAGAVGVVIAVAMMYGLLRYVAFADAPLEMSALFVGGYYEPGTDVGGIKWQDNYSDVRVDIVNRTDLDYEDLDISIVPSDEDIGVAELGQTTRVPSVYFIPHNFSGSVKLTKNQDGGFSQTYSSRVAPSNLGQRVHCERFTQHNLIEVVVALAKLNGNGKPRPNGIRIKAQYNTIGGRLHSVEKYLPLNSLPQ